MASWGHVECLRGVPAVLLDLRVKRALDFAFSSLLLILCLPVLALVAALIKIDSRGPVFFRQERVGARAPTHRDPAWRRRTFLIFKFRSMRVGADPEVHRAYVKALASGAVPVPGDGVYKMVNDPRITRVGRLLRRTSLDELPQLLNVVRGEMSLVGPRPVPTYEVEEYAPWHYERLAALPGMTGLWQVRGRGRVSLDEGVRMDIEYVRTRTVWLDLKILCLTVPAVFSRKGAG